MMLLASLLIFGSPFFAGIDPKTIRELTPAEKSEYESISDMEDEELAKEAKRIATHGDVTHACPFCAQTFRRRKDNAREHAHGEGRSSVCSGYADIRDLLAERNIHELLAPPNKYPIEQVPVVDGVPRSENRAYNFKRHIEKIGEKHSLLDHPTFVCVLQNFTQLRTKRRYKKKGVRNVINQFLCYLTEMIFQLLYRKVNAESSLR